jgi:nicotinamide riboside transporter PnuC
LAKIAFWGRLLRLVLVFPSSKHQLLPPFYIHMLYLIAQIAIVGFGISSSFLIAQKNKWGFVLALLAQPFWVIIGITDGSWGVLVLALVYTLSSAYGVFVWCVRDSYPYSWAARPFDIVEAMTPVEQRPS